MDYEKKYKEALDNLHRIKNESPEWWRENEETMQEIFPELKESESEDERIRKVLIRYFTLSDEHDYNEACGVIVAWLEKQGEHAKFRDSIQIGDKVTRNEDGVLVNLFQLNRVAKKDEKQGEQNPAWSEEDEEKRKRIMHRLSLDGTINNKDLADINDWLKSLKERYTWKPSDEQMDTLEYYMHTLICNKHKEILFGLYVDLKKLKE